MLITHSINFVLGVGCNLNCDYCFNYNTIRNTPNNTIDLTSLDYHFNQLPNTTLLNIGGMGEPCLHPQFMDIIGLAFKHNMLVNITSNGTMTKSKLINPLIQQPMNLRKLHKLILSYHHEQLDADQRQRFINDAQLAHKYFSREVVNVTIVLDDYVIDHLDEIQSLFKSTTITPVYQLLDKSYTSKYGDQIRNYTDDQMARIRSASIYVYDPDIEHDIEWPYSKTPCVSGFKTFTVNPNGDEYDCEYDLMHREKIGNINDMIRLRLSDSCRKCTATLSEQGECCPVNRGNELNN